LGLHIMDDQYIRTRSTRTRCFSLSGNIALGMASLMFRIYFLLSPLSLWTRSNDSYLSVKDSFVDEGGLFHLLVAIDRSAWRLYQSIKREGVTRMRKGIKIGQAMEASPVIPVSLVAIASGACRRLVWYIATVWQRKQA
jgi:hypothetical protein